MNRSDMRKELVGGKKRLDPTEHDSKEAQDARGHMSMDASMGRSPAAARKGQDEFFKEAKAQQAGEHDIVEGGRDITVKSVDADHVLGDGGAVRTKTAEGMSDMASGKANRKEAMEPEREMNEKAAMGRERSVPAKNSMGHGERETIARHTI